MCKWPNYGWLVEIEKISKTEKLWENTIFQSNCTGRLPNTGVNTILPKVKAWRALTLLPDLTCPSIWQPVPRTRAHVQKVGSRWQPLEGLSPRSSLEAGRCTYFGRPTANLSTPLRTWHFVATLQSEAYGTSFIGLRPLHSVCLRPLVALLWSRQLPVVTTHPPHKGLPLPKPTAGFGLLQVEFAFARRFSRFGPTSCPITYRIVKSSACRRHLFRISQYSSFSHILTFNHSFSTILHYSDFACGLVQPLTQCCEFSIGPNIWPFGSGPRAFLWNTFFCSGPFPSANFKIMNIPVRLVQFSII